MKNSKDISSAPIGVFDYGMGGLTVIQALAAALPEEHFVFLADEAKQNVPEEYEAARRHRTQDALRYASFVYTQGVKLIVVGCNLMSAFAVDALRQAFDVPVIGLVEPALTALSQTLEHPETEKVAVFTTQMAAHLHLFTKQLQTAFPGIQVAEIGCGKLPALISAGHTEGEEPDRVVRDYALQTGDGVTAALLTCTRFPVLMRSFSRALPGIPILDPAQTLPQIVEKALDQAGIRAPRCVPGESLLYTTGDVAAFSNAASTILGNSVRFLAAKAPF